MRTPSPEHVAAIRRFNRYYTRTIGTLDEGLLASPLSLAEARVLYEIASRERSTASGIAAELNLDMGYLSRILRGFAAHKLVNRIASAKDGRQSLIVLTPAGRKQFAALNEGSDRQVREMIQSLNPSQQDQLVRSMSTIEALLGPQESNTEQELFTLRAHRPGDMGWVIERHGTLYAQEYGWNERFEALVARITADFIDNFDPKRERCWIAERNGERIGCVFLIQDGKKTRTAKLRLLIVDPAARGLGLGRALVAECTRFARQTGYRRITLWTNSILHAARKIYQDEGYQLVEEEKHHSFGKDLVGQNWELKL